MTSSPNHLLRTYGLGAIAVLTALSGAVGTPVQALTIDATYGSGITSAMETDIQGAINFYDSTFTNPITVDITFQNMTSGLGESSQSVYEESYTNYTSWLNTSAKASGNPYLTTAVSNLSSGNVPPSGDMWLTSSQLAALGHSVTPNPGGTVGVNFSDVFFGSPSPGLYDGTAVLQHEIDEILGIGGAGSTLESPGSPSLTGMGSMDLYRYSAPGVPSFTNSTLATSYFSIDGGKTVLAYFNQTGGGSDYGDWATNCTTGPILVQNAYGCPGKVVDLLAEGSNSPEMIALQAVGYTVAVPEPSTYALMLTGLGFVYVAARRKRRTLAAALRPA